jgi:penicillin amidase
VLLDPEDGLLATANSFLPVALPEWFEGDFDTPFRMDRIFELLAPRRDWTLAGLGRLQRDTTSLWARRLVARLGAGYDGDAGRAADALAAWDGNMAARGAAALFALVERELQRAVFEDEAIGAGIPRFGTRWRLLRLVEGELSEAWFDDVATAEPENRRATIARALAAAWRAGVARWGEDVAAWRYAEIHTLTLDHPLGGLPLVGRWFRRGPLPLPGAATTVLAFGGPWQGEAIDVSYGPSLRQLFDAAEPAATLSVLPGGVAGHPGDPHYADQLPLYVAGEYRAVAWSVAEARAAAASELVLAPPEP